MSFWLPGFFGSLAATSLQPGWTIATTYYHTSVSAEGDVARAREFTIGTLPLPVGVTANLGANLNARADLALVNPTYVFEPKILGGQLAVGVLGLYGKTSTSLAATLSGSLITPFFSIPFSRSDSISDSVSGIGDLLPQASLRWNAGVHNFMVYVTGVVPVGPTIRVDCPISASGMQQSMEASATPILIRRPATNSQACSAIRPTQPIAPLHTATAPICISIGGPRNF